MSVMLKGSALSLFTRKGNECGTDEEGFALPGEWFNSKEKKSRLFGAWHAMSLLTAIEGSPDESEVAVFRGFLSRLMSLQHQLHEE